MDHSESNELVFSWGDFQLSEVDTQGNFLAAGTTGSGKTIVLRLLMQDTLALVGQGRGYKALVYDAKSDVIPILSSYCKPELIKTLNPFDARGYSWWISKDVQESAVAMELAFALIADTSDNSKFFQSAARHLCWGVMCSYMLSEIDWTLGDLLRAFRHPVRCKRILKRHPETSWLVRMYFREEKLLNDIFATISVTLMLYEPIGGCWDLAHKEGKKLSLRDAMTTEQIIILGNTEVARVPIDNINRCIFKRWTDLILSQSDGTTDRFWTFIDELSEAGPLPSIVPLLKKGRSKGARCAIACQSIAGLQDSKMYGESVSKDMLAVLSNRFIGRLECPLTAEYFSQYVGDQEIQRTAKSSTISHSSQQPGSTTMNYSRATQRTVLPSEYMAIAASGRENGLVGQFKVRSTDACWDRVEPTKLFDEMLLPKAHGVKDLVPRDSKSQFLRPWTSEEKEIFAPKTTNLSPFKNRPIKAEPKTKPDVVDFIS